MNRSGFMERLDKCPTLLQCSIWDIVTDEEEDQLRSIIRAISERYPGHDVRITVGIKERRQDDKK